MKTIVIVEDERGFWHPQVIQSSGGTITPGSMPLSSAGEALEWVREELRATLPQTCESCEENPASIHLCKDC